MFNNLHSFPSFFKKPSISLSKKNGKILLIYLLLIGLLSISSLSLAQSSSDLPSNQINKIIVPTVTQVDPDQKIDPNFGIPSPDVTNKSRNLVNYDHAVLASSLLLCVSIIPIGYALRRSVKEKTLLPIAVALSGSAGVFAEVYTDVLGAVYWVNDPGHFATRTIFHLFGRDMSFIPVSAWIAFGAVLTYLCFEVISRKPKTKWLWAVFLAACLLDMAFEEPMLNYGGLYAYYGNQPFIVLSKFPWWWMPMNAGGLFLAAALAYRYRENLKGIKALAMFWVTPAAFMAFYGFCAWPTMCVINGNFSWLTTQLAGALGITVATLTTAGVMHIVLQRNPFALESSESSVHPTETNSSNHARHSVEI